MMRGAIPAVAWWQEMSWMETRRGKVKQERSTRRGNGKRGGRGERKVA